MSHSLLFFSSLVAHLRSFGNAQSTLNAMGEKVIRAQRVIAVACVIAAGILVAAEAEGDGTAPMPMIFFDSSVGEVTFPHEAHFDDLEIACETCHHETNAKMLDIPHVEYFQDFWIECATCHHPSEKPQESHSCASCHHCPVNCADETLSTKVVIHENCWRCHEVGTGPEASASCVSCHNGPKREW